MGATGGPRTALERAMAAGRVPYRPWEGQGLLKDHCFLCGAALTRATRSDEDVLPRWIRRRLPGNRHGQSLELPNQTTIPFGSVLIPCCKPCNNEHLSRLEQQVAEAFDAGADAVNRLPEKVLRPWVAKIAYGLRRNDMRLRKDRRDATAGTIATQADLEQMALLHMILQEARGIVHVTPGHSSFVALTAQMVHCATCDFDIAVPVGWPTALMLRLGEIVLIGAADDRGSLRRAFTSPSFRAAREVHLHPVQARALWALLLEEIQGLDPRQHPLRFGVQNEQLWIDREPGSAFRHKLPAASGVSAELILSTLLNDTEASIRSIGGPTGLLVSSTGHPRQLPFRHGSLRLDDLPPVRDSVVPESGPTSG